MRSTSRMTRQGPRNREQLREIVDNMPGFAFRRVLERSGAITYPYIGAHMRKLYGIGPRREDTVRKSFESYLHPDDRQAFLAAMAVSAQHLSPLEIAVRLGSSTGVSGWLRIVSYPHKLDDGAIQWDCVALDISRAKALETHGAYHEAMTGLPNRALFLHWLDHALERAKMLQTSAFVVALELVSLTSLRESSGFEVGDACIREAARRLQKAMLFADTIAYTGGGGFLIVLIQADGQNDFTAPLRAIRRQFEPRFHHKGQELPLKISMGISVVPGDGLEAETLIGNATTALNKAKHTPGQPYQFYNAQMTERAVSRLSVESELRNALRNRELMLFYQPQYDARSLRIVGIEALVRWNHPNRGMILPGEFISVAEESGLIVALGEFCLREACTQARDWQRRGISDVPISVNISGVQLLEHDLADNVMAILAETGLAPSRLMLELTESTIVRSADAAERTMTTLSQSGIGFSVDDFGIEHSALSLLNRLPIETLKIDYSFISQMTTCRVHAALVQAIISMTHAMSMTVVAEGVETRQQLTYLQAYQCDTLQGFLLSRPMPAAKLETLFARQNKKQLKAGAREPQPSVSAGAMNRVSTPV